MNKIHQICKFNYYMRFRQEMPIRKELEKDNRKMKKKIKNYSLPFIYRWQDRIVDNKKKTIFFIGLFGLFNYYYGPSWIYNKYMKREPLNKKFRRWIFGEKNQENNLLQEQRPESKLKESTINQLREMYLILENELFFGASRKLLYEVYNNLNLFQKDDERQGFYRQSGYYKKRNQKVCSMHFSQFVKLFEDAIKKLRKTNNELQEDQFLDQFLQECNKNKELIKEWEIKIQTKRKEYYKLIPELQDYKERVIKKILSENPYAEEGQIQQEVLNYGLYGLSLKDKLIIINQQLSLHKAILDYKMTKLENNDMFGSLGLSIDKERKLKQKIQSLQNKIDQLNQKQQEYWSEFTLLFKKQQLFEI